MNIKGMIKQQNKKKSLIIHILAICVLLITLPAVFSLIYFNTEVSGYLKKRAEQNADFFISELVENNSTTINMLQNTTSYLLSDKEIQNIMVKNESLTGVELSVLQNTIGRVLLYNVSWVEKYITSLFIFREDNVALTTFVSGVFNNEYIRMKKVYHELIELSSMQTLVTSVSSDTNCFFVVNYTNINNMEINGKIIIEVNSDSLVDAPFLNNLYHGTEIILSNNQGEILASSEVEDKDSLSVEFKKFNQGIIPEKEYTTWRGQEYYHRREGLDNTDLYLDVFIPQDELLHEEYIVGVWYSIILTTTLLLTAIISILAYLGVSKPLKESISKIERMAGGDLSVRMEETKYRETDRLVDSFNRMAEKLDALYQDAYDKGVLLRESEFKLLEAQINPHFLFNLLEVINLRCMQGGQKDTSQMITDLARLLRSNVGHQGEQKVTIGQELEYVQYYLNLQKVRFTDELTYSIVYEDAKILQYYLPKLTIQPLVENCIVHGLENKRGGGNVDVHIWEKDENVYINISDNGIGFDPNLIDEYSINSKHNHVAITNIKRRIKLLYGDSGNLRIMSSPGHGTTFLVILPKDRIKA